LKFSDDWGITNTLCAKDRVITGLFSSVIIVLFLYLSTPLSCTSPKKCSWCWWWSVFGCHEECAPVKSTKAGGVPSHLVVGPVSQVFAMLVCFTFSFFTCSLCGITCAGFAWKCRLGQARWWKLVTYDASGRFVMSCLFVSFHGSLYSSSLAVRSGTRPHHCRLFHQVAKMNNWLWLWLCPFLMPEMFFFIVYLYEVEMAFGGDYDDGFAVKSAAADNGGSEDGASPAPRQRSMFPETWLWDILVRYWQTITEGCGVYFAILTSA